MSRGDPSPKTVQYAFFRDGMRPFSTDGTRHVGRRDASSQRSILTGVSCRMDPLGTRCPISSTRGVTGPLERAYGRLLRRQKSVRVRHFPTAGTRLPARTPATSPPKARTVSRLSFLTPLPGTMPRSQPNPIPALNYPNRWHGRRHSLPIGVSSQRQLSAWPPGRVSALRIRPPDMRTSVAPALASPPPSVRRRGGSRCHPLVGQGEGQRQLCPSQRAALKNEHRCQGAGNTFDDPAPPFEKLTRCLRVCGPISNAPHAKHFEPVSLAGRTASPSRRSKCQNH